MYYDQLPDSFPAADFLLPDLLPEDPFFAEVFCEGLPLRAPVPADPVPVFPEEVLCFFEAHFSGYRDASLAYWGISI